MRFRPRRRAAWYRPGSPLPQDYSEVARSAPLRLLPQRFWVPVTSSISLSKCGGRWIQSPQSTACRRAIHSFSAVGLGITPGPVGCSSGFTRLIHDNTVAQVFLGPLSRHLQAGHDVINGLRDVGRVIADTLDLLGAARKMRAGGNIARIFHHVGQQFAEQ